MSEVSSHQTLIFRIFSFCSARWRSFLAYCLAFFGSIAGPVWVHRLRPTDLTYPWRVKDSDLSSVYSLAQALGQSWTGLVHHSLGAPFNANLALAFIPDDLHLEIMRVLVHVTNNPFTAVNLFYVLTYGLCGIAFLYLCDRMRCDRHFGVPVAIAYSWLPYHFTRMNDGHVFLSAYYMLPIGLLALINLTSWLSGQQETFLPKSRTKFFISAIAIVAVGSSGAYYGLFFALLTLATLCLIPQRGKSFTIWINQIFVVGVVSFGFVVAPLLRNIWARTHGLNVQLKRDPTESLQFGGNLARLFVPWGVWIPNRLQPIVQRQEFEWLAVPMIAVTGIWLLTIGVLRGLARAPGTGSSSQLQPLYFLFLWALLFFSAGGLSFVFAHGVDSSFRTWNRMSIVIMTVSLLAVTIHLNSHLRSTLLRRLAPMSLVVLAVTTQLWPIQNSGISGEPDVVSVGQFQRLERIASRIERNIPKDCSILQLPIMAFPEGGIVEGVGNGDHLWFPLLMDGYRWSYGSPKGSESGDYWLKFQSSQELAVAEAKSRQFCGMLTVRNPAPDGLISADDAVIKIEDFWLVLWSRHSLSKSVSNPKIEP